MDMREEWLETILKRDTENNSVARVLSRTTESVVERGDNYASDICRITMDVVLGSGKTAKKTVIAKSIPTTEMRSKLLTEWGLFRKEIKMFDVILPTMEALLEEVNDKGEPLWGKCYYSKPYELLVLEDLRVLGYKMANRREGLNTDHAHLVLRNMAKFHAMSLAIEARGALDTLEYRNNIFSVNGENMTAYLDETYSQFARIIETTWEPEWKGFADKIRNLCGKSTDIVGCLFDASKSKFNVLNHGDCWVNNVMFKYGLDEESPTSMRFVDFQLCYYNTFAYDLIYFLTSSIKNELRVNHYKAFLDYYHKNLMDFLDRFGYEAARPTLADVESEVDRCFLYCFILGVLMLPLVLADPEEAPDMEKLLEEWENQEKRNIDIKPLLGKQFTEAMKIILKECDTCGAFDRIKELNDEK